jgi:hypothetical protein
LLRSLRRAADRTIAFVTPRLAEVRTWPRTTLAGMVTALAAQRVYFEARLAQLKRSILQGGLPVESDAARSSSAPIELPGGDDRRT